MIIHWEMMEDILGLVNKDRGIKMEQEKFNEAILKIDCYREALDIASDYGADEDVLNALMELVVGEITAPVWAEIKKIIKEAGQEKDKELDASETTA